MKSQIVNAERVGQETVTSADPVVHVVATCAAHADVEATIAGLAVASKMPCGGHLSRQFVDERRRRRCLGRLDHHDFSHHVQLLLLRCISPMVYATG